MGYVALLVLAILTLLSAVVVTRMIRQDGRGGAPPPRSHHGDGPPRPWWTDGEEPLDIEDPAAPRVLLVDKSPRRPRP